MIAVIFEVVPTGEGRQTYLELAAELKPLLEEIPGFISIERFQSLVDERKVLSLSFWEDEAAITRWRTLEQHRAAQLAGRHRLFEQYRIRVAGVLRDYGLDDRDQAPGDIDQQPGHWT